MAWANGFPRVVESDLRVVVTAAYYGRLYRTASKMVVEKVGNDNNKTRNYNIRRENPTRAALALDPPLLAEHSDGKFTATEAGRQRFKLGEYRVT